MRSNHLSQAAVSRHLPDISIGNDDMIVSLASERDLRYLTASETRTPVR